MQYFFWRPIKELTMLLILMFTPASPAPNSRRLKSRSRKILSNKDCETIGPLGLKRDKA